MIQSIKNHASNQEGGSPDTPNRARHVNNIGFLRVLFATLVIVAHSCEFIDGNRSREPLNWLFGPGTPSFGELAVLAFFVISGFLITASRLSATRTSDYLVKRIARIVPGFVVAFLVSASLVAFLAGAHLAQLTMADLRHLLGKLIRLDGPDVPGVFTGLPYPYLNGALWTIGYEFRCYLFVILFGLVGWHAHRHRYLAATAVVTALSAALGNGWIHIPAAIAYSKPAFELVRDPVWMLHFLSAFMIGGLFRLYRDRIMYRGELAAIAAGCLVACFALHLASNLAAAAFGGYLIFWYGVARPASSWFGIFNGSTDVSYGIYLYGWPVGMLLLWWGWRDIHPALLIVATLILVLPIAWLSWHFIESPVLDQVATRRLRRSQEAAIRLRDQTTDAPATAGLPG